MRQAYFFFFNGKAELDQPPLILNSGWGQCIQIYNAKTDLTAEYTLFFSSAHETFTKTEHVLGHKENFQKLKGIEVLQCAV